MWFRALIAASLVAAAAPAWGASRAPARPAPSPAPVAPPPAPPVIAAPPAPATPPAPDPYGGFFISGAQLLDNCRRDAGAPLPITCAEYVVGVADSIAFYDKADSKKVRIICIPKPETATQLGDIVFNYLTAHPDLKTDSGATAAIAAFQEAFPCP